MNPSCGTCGITIRWQPTIVGSKTFCCIGCAYGGPCVCDYERLPNPDDRTSLVIWNESKLEIRVYSVREE
jgi:hypothetical protein